MVIHWHFSNVEDPQDMFQEDITEADNQEGNQQPFLISFKDLLLEDNLDSFRADTKVEAY